MELKKLDETKVLKDPVHSYIHIHYEVIWNCLDSKEFQRSYKTVRGRFSSISNS